MAGRVLGRRRGRRLGRYRGGRTGTRAEASRAQAGPGTAEGGVAASGTCWVAAGAQAGSDDTPPWSLTAPSIDCRSSGRAAVATAPTRAAHKVPRSAVFRRAARVSGGTLAEHAMDVATAAKGVVSGRAAMDCHSRSAHRWRVSSATVRKSPASRYVTQPASAAANAWPSAP